MLPPRGEFCTTWLVLNADASDVVFLKHTVRGPHSLLDPDLFLAILNYNGIAFVGFHEVMSHLNIACSTFAGLTKYLYVVNAAKFPPATATELPAEDAFRRHHSCSGIWPHHPIASENAFRRHCSCSRTSPPPPNYLPKYLLLWRRFSAPPAFWR